jgi:hypothetical protein
MEDMVCTKRGMSWLLGKVVEYCPGKDGIQPVRTTLLSLALKRLIEKKRWDLGFLE